MTRDWDVIREVLTEVEEVSEQRRNDFGYGVTDGLVNDPTKVGHALLLYRAGFIEAVDGETLAGPGILSPRLTWAGHDLLDTMRSKPVWDRIKSLARTRGLELTFDAVKALGAVAVQQLMDGSPSS